MAVDMIIGSLIAALVLYAIWKGSSVKEKIMNLDKVPVDVANWKDLAAEYSRRFGVPVDIILATIWVESAGRMDAVGSANERGLMQLKEIAVQDVRLNKFGEFPKWRTAPIDNIGAGTAFLALQHRRTGTWERAIKAYNQGEAGAKKYPDRAEEYFQKVESKRRFFK